MAVLTGAYETYETVGLREDLSDIIYNISPTETPFMMAVGRGSASATNHEWQNDSLVAAQENSQVEGDEATFTEPPDTTRIGNRTQISHKTVAISGTLEAVDKAGRKTEVGYQMAKRGKELKRDMENNMTQNRASAVGASGTARKAGSLEAAYGVSVAGNVSRGAGGAGTDIVNSTWVAATDGTQRALTETLLKGVIQGVWTNGGEGNLIMTGPFNKTVISGFSGNATRFDRSEDKRLVTAIDVYVSDFGEHRIVANRFSRDRTVHVLTTSLFSVDYLRPFMQFPIAKTGDSEKRMLLCEWTLRSNQILGSGVVADVTTA